MNQYYSQCGCECECAGECDGEGEGARKVENCHRRQVKDRVQLRIDITGCAFR